MRLIQLKWQAGVGTAFVFSLAAVTQAQNASASVGTITPMMTSSASCADVAALSKQNGAPIIAWNCNGQVNQQWSLVPIGQNAYLISSVNSGQCLDVAGASKLSGTPVLQWPCGVNKQNQQWLLSQIGSVYQISSVNSGECLVSIGGGAQLQQAPCNASVAGQLWSLPALNFSTAAAPLSTSTVINATPTSALLGQNVTIGIKTSTSSSAVPSGSVSIYDGSTLLSNQAVDSSGQTSYTSSSLALGTHQLSAVFGGGNTFAGSQSSVIAISVAQPNIGEKATQSNNFVDSIGIQTHLTYTNTPYFTAFPQILSELQAVGIRHVRDGYYPWPASSPIVAAHQAFANSGIKTTYVFPIDPVAVTVPNIVALSGMTKDFEALEPTNECDAFPNCGGGNLIGINNVLATLPTLRSAATSLGLPLLGPSYTVASAYTQSGNISSSINFNNLHVYFGGRNPGSFGWGDGDAQGHGYGSFDWWIDQGNQDAPGIPDIITETGYMSLTSPTPYTVSEGVEATYTPRSLFLAYNKGVKRTFIYQLLEDNTLAFGYGILRPDLSEKPVFTALKHLTALLSDQGPAFAPGALSYSVTGADASLQHTLLQKRDGSFWLALWLEQSSYNVYTNVDTPVLPQAAVVTIGGGESAKTIYVFDRAGNVSQNNVSNSGTQLTLPITDQLTFIQITPQ